MPDDILADGADEFLKVVAPAPIPIPTHLASGEEPQRFGRFLKLPPIQAVAFCGRSIRSSIAPQTLFGVTFRLLGSPLLVTKLLDHGERASHVRCHRGTFDPHLRE